MSVEIEQRLTRSMMNCIQRMKKRMLFCLINVNNFSKKGKNIMKKWWIAASIGSVIAIIVALLYRKTLKEFGEMDFTMFVDQ